MFSAYCKQCGTVVLLGPADVSSIHNTSSGIVLYFRCSAGHFGAWLTGRRPSSRTHRAGGQGTAAGLGTDSPLATSSGPSSLSGGRHIWWRRSARRGPLRSRPGAEPGRGWLRAG